MAHWAHAHWALAHWAWNGKFGIGTVNKSENVS